MQKYKNVLLTIGTLLIVFLVVLPIVLRKVKTDRQIANAGIPYTDDRTVCISINGEQKFILGGKVYDSEKLQTLLEQYRKENGPDCPIVLEFAGNSVNDDVSQYLSPITSGGYYNLFFLYKPKTSETKIILPYAVPCPDARINSLFIYAMKKDAEKRYRVIFRKDSDTGFYSITRTAKEIDALKELDKKELASLLKKHPNALIAFLPQDGNLLVDDFLDLLYMCKMCGCSVAPTTGAMSIGNPGSGAQSDKIESTTR